MQKTVLKHWIQINRMSCTSVVFGAVLFMAMSAFCIHTDAGDLVGDIQHSIPFGHIRNAHAQTTNQTDTTPFITTWGTTEDAPSIGFSMDVSSEGAIILWGDDSITHVSTNGVKTHEYTTTGKHTVKILGGLTHFYFSGDGDVTPRTPPVSCAVGRHKMGEYATYVFQCPLYDVQGNRYPESFWSN